MCFHVARGVLLVLGLVCMHVPSQSGCVGCGYPVGHFAASCFHSSWYTGTAKPASYAAINRHVVGPPPHTHTRLMLSALAFGHACCSVSQLICCLLVCRICADFFCRVCVLVMGCLAAAQPAGFYHACYTQALLNSARWAATSGASHALVHYLHHRHFSAVFMVYSRTIRQRSC
jgi:hypothetical protein